MLTIETAWQENATKPRSLNLLLKDVSFKVSSLSSDAETRRVSTVVLKHAFEFLFMKFQNALTHGTQTKEKCKAALLNAGTSLP